MSKPKPKCSICGDTGFIWMIVGELPCTACDAYRTQNRAWLSAGIPQKDKDR